MVSGPPPPRTTPAVPAVPSALRIWWHASRPATLAASVSPVIAGAGVAARAGPFRWGPCLGALAVAVALQFGVNYANDHADFVRGADAPGRLGPPRAASSGVVPPGQVRAAALAAFLAAAVIGLWLALATDPWLLAVGAAAIAAGWLYTGGPRPYGYAGFGESVCFVFFGLVATGGTVLVVTGRLVWLALPAALAMGCLASAILLLNNLRDIPTDRLVGKRTLAVRLGPARTRWVLAGLLAAAVAAPVVAAATGLAGPPALLPLALVPLAVQIHRQSGTRGPDAPAVLVRALKRTALLELATAVLFALGVIL